MDKIQPGSHVRARTAENRWVTLRAASTVTDGIDFPVVWLLDEEAWTAASEGKAYRPGVPWPAEDVRVEEGAANDE